MNEEIRVLLESINSMLDEIDSLSTTIDIRHSGISEMLLQVEDLLEENDTKEKT